MKDIVIVANFIGALDGGKNSRFTYLADKLNEIHGMSVEIVSSSFSHDYKKQRDNIPNIFEYNPTPSYEIKRLHITENGKIVGIIVFTTKFTPTNAASIQLCRLYTKRNINPVIKRHIK